MPSSVFAVMTVAAASPTIPTNAADDWVNMATVSMTNATTPKLPNRSICYTDGVDAACDNTSQYIQTGGLINAGALQVSGYASADTIHTSGTVRADHPLLPDARRGLSHHPPPPSTRTFARCSTLRATSTASSAVLIALPVN